MKATPSTLGMVLAIAFVGARSAAGDLTLDSSYAFGPADLPGITPVSTDGKFGLDVEGADLNGDGQSELLIGARNDSTVYITHLSETGPVGPVSKIRATDPAFGGQAGSARFGNGLAVLDDLDGNGVGELAVGAPLGGNAGSVWIVFLDEAGGVYSVLGAVQLASETSALLAGLPAEAHFGGRVAAGDDLDGDGRRELLVSASLGDGDPASPGAAYLLTLDAAGGLTAVADLSLLPAPGPQPGNGDNFGFALSSLGDPDSDGLWEVLVGAREADTLGLDSGTIWLLELDASGAVQSARDLVAEAPGLFSGLDPEERLGTDIELFHDVDGNGCADVLVMAQAAFAPGGGSKGALWLLELACDGSVLAATEHTPDGLSLQPPAQAGALIGVAGVVGDLDGDSFSEVAIGSFSDTTVWVLAFENPVDAQLLDEGETKIVGPAGSGDPSLVPLAEVTNLTGGDGASVSAVAPETVSRGVGGFGLVGLAIDVETSMDDGEFFMTVSVPFDASDLGGANPALVDLVYYDVDDAAWELAVSSNTADSPGHGGKIGDRFSVLLPDVFPDPPYASAELGDHGVVWNTQAARGYVWANVDHTTEFAASLSPLAPYGCGVNPAGSLGLASGEAHVGKVLHVNVDNPLGSSPAGALAGLLVSLQADPGFPCGTLLPGWGLSGPAGELLVNVLPPDPVATLLGGPWSGAGQPVAMAVPIPDDPIFAGLFFHLQGVLASPTSLQLAGAVRVRVGP